MWRCQKIQKSRAFIIRHAACHQSLTPHRALNKWLGRIAFRLYGFARFRGLIRFCVFRFRFRCLRFCRLCTIRGSSLSTVFTRPSRFVPVGVSGRRCGSGERARGSSMT